MGYNVTLSRTLAGRGFAAVWALCMVGLAAAQAPAPAVQQSAPVQNALPERSVSEWLMRMHEASRLRSYIGTFVVLSNNGGMASARIRHACDGEQQVERVESLTGAPRSTFRRNEEVVTFLPERRRLTTVVGWITAVVMVLEVGIIDAQAARGVAALSLAAINMGVAIIAGR